MNNTQQQIYDILCKKVYEMREPKELLLSRDCDELIKEIMVEIKKQEIGEPIK